MTRQRHFARGSGCYACTVCGKQTRETGEGESDVGMCAFCYIESGLLNMQADGHITDAQFEDQMATLRKKYGRPITLTGVMVECGEAEF